MNNSDSDQAYNSNDVFGDEMSGTINASVLLERMEKGNEGAILCNVIELCQLLVMGNEETLSGFPTKQCVPCLIGLLKMESNFEIMLHACRALQYLTEVLPRSVQLVVEAVPALLEKLQVVEYVDVAEQSLQVLDLLSRKHSKAILKQNGIASCLKFIDFFSISAQRTSLSIVSHCCLVVSKDDFHFVRDSLSLLSARLLIQDKKSVESTCLCFSRLVENFKCDAEKLDEISAYNLFKHFQHLLLEPASAVNSSTFVAVLHTMNALSLGSNRLHLQLLRSNISDTLLQILIGPQRNEVPSQHFELVSRSAQEIFEIVSLIGNLLPPPPQDGIFSINSTIFSGSSDDYQEHAGASAVWQWCDSKGTWHSYPASDSRIIEVAHHMGESEIGMSLMGRAYTVDLQMMQQINEETGTSRPVQRVVTCPRSQSNAAEGREAPRPRTSPRRGVVQLCPEETSALVVSLLPVIYDIFCTTASLAVKHKCLQTLLRMSLHSDAADLRMVLENVPISSAIAGMLTSYDSRTVVTAVQICHILMQKLPDVFSVFFQRQGVLHQMLHLAQTGLYDSSITSFSSSSSSSSHTKEDPSASTSQNGAQTTNQVPPKARQALLSPLPHARNSPQVRFRVSDEVIESTPDVSFLASSTPVVFHPRGGKGSLDDGTAGSRSTSPTSLSSPSSPSINPAHNPEPHKSSLIQVRLTDVLKSKKFNHRKEESSIFRFGPVQSANGSHSATAQSSAGPAKLYHGYAHSLSAPPPHHHSTPSVYMPSKNLGSIVSQRIASISSASSGSSSLHSSSYRSNNHFCNGDKTNRMSSPPSARHQTPTQSSSSSSSSSSSTSHVSATKARLFGSSKEQMFPSSKSSSLAFPRGLLASLNPKKWAKFSSSPVQKSLGKETTPSKPAEPLQKRVANSKEVINAWVIQNASLFMDKYFSHSVQSYPHPSLNILSQLSSTLLNLGDIATDENHLRSLAHLLCNNDISPFELIQSSFIDMMTSYLTSDLATLKLDRLRLFLHVFLGCPKGEFMSSGDVWCSGFNAVHQPMHHLVTKLLNCFHHLEKFQLKTSDHSSAFRHSLASNPNTYRFYKADLIKCSLQLHPSCAGVTNHWNVGLIRIDPFAIVQSFESILTQTVKIADSDLSEDEEDFDEMPAVGTEHLEGSHSMSSSSSSSSLSSAPPTHTKGFEFFIGNNTIPNGMTVYQAIKRFSIGRSSGNALIDDASAQNDLPTLSQEHRIWLDEHAIWFKPRGLAPADPTEAPLVPKSGPIVIHPRKVKFDPPITIHQHNLQLHRRHYHHHHRTRQPCHLHPPRSHPARYLQHNYQHVHQTFDPPQLRGCTSSSSSSSLPGEDSSRGCSTLSKLDLRPLTQSRININDPSLPVMSLLRVVHSLIVDWHFLYKALDWSDLNFAENFASSAINQSDFISNKLTSKLTKQLQDPIVLLSGSLPLWVSHVPVPCPFLLSFQTRHHLFCLVCLDKGRALLKFNERNSEPTSSASSSSSSSSSAVDGQMGTSGRINCRVERVKKVIKRANILEQAEHVISDTVGSGAILEIKYDEEIGFGLGPTLEFYALVSQEFKRFRLNMWIGQPSTSEHFEGVLDEDDFKDSSTEAPMEDGTKADADTVDQSVFVTPPGPFLHPLPLPDDVDPDRLKSLLDKFEFLGRFMAKSLVDSRLVDLPLSPMFYKWLLSKEHTADLSDLKHIDSALYSSLMKLQSIVNRKKFIESSSYMTQEEVQDQVSKLTLDGVAINDLYLTFTLPGQEGFELFPGASNVFVTVDNLDHYVDLVVHWILVRGIHRQLSAFKLGFETFLPLSSLQFFYADELDRLFCGSHRKEDWTAKYLSEACRPDHGYNQGSTAVQFLYAILSSFDRHKQRMFVQFVTGSPRLPVGGLKSLNPPLTIVRKTMEHSANPDDFLPSVMTCVNYLKLPNYSNLETMDRKLDMAMKDGQLSFHLS